MSIGEDGGVTIKGKYSEAKVVTADVEAGDAGEWEWEWAACVCVCATSGVGDCGGECCLRAGGAAGGWTPQQGRKAAP